MVRFKKSFLLTCLMKNTFMVCLMAVFSLPTVSNAVTKRDVIDDFLYYGTACPGYANAVWADADGIDAGHPTYGPYETMVVFTTLTGYGVPVSEFTPPGKWYYFSGIDSVCGGTAPWDKGRLKIHFIDMLAPGFDQTNPATWVYKSIPDVSIDATHDACVASDIPWGDAYQSVLAYRELGQTDIISRTPSTCGQNGWEHYYFSDPLGIKELYVSTDFCENNLDDLILDADVAGTEVIIDNGDSGTSYDGPWDVSTAPNPYGDDSLENDHIGPGPFPPVPVYHFETRVSKRFEYQVYLWWTELPTRSDNVEVKIYDGDTQLDTIYVNQQANGGQWNLLGTYQFICGQAEVHILSPFSSATSSVCADAVKFVAFGGNTPTGSNVQVTEGDVTITFDTVTTAGHTTVTESGTGPDPPAGFQTCVPPVYYDITTTATYSGTIEVCLSYDDSVCDESNLNLFHYEGGTWVDVTTSVDTVANIICGEVTSLSEFLLATYTGPIFVDINAIGANNGRSWADAYNYLQDALAAAVSGDEIFVAEGTYKPDQGGGQTPGDRSAKFQLKNDVAIYGGYAGFGEPDPNVRDIDAYETILSGNIGMRVNTDNSYHVVASKGTDATTILDGFTITAGNANGSGTNMEGGGMHNARPGNPTITNCTFRGNSAGYGGGMYNFDHSSPTVTNCAFSGNSAGSGGGMYNTEVSSPVLTNCTFSGNSAGIKGNGGGMYNYNNSPTLTNCILWGNSDGGGMDESAQIYNNSSTPVINYCCVQGWTGGLGGTGNIGDDPLFVDAPDNLRLLADSNCIDTGNNSAVPSAVTTDLDGHPRIVDGDGNITALVDMGAYEFNWAYIGDFDGEYDVDFADFAIFALAWLTEDGDARWNPDCDISIPADNYINWRDLDVFSDNWPARARFSPISNLLFSEYVEGFGFNQAVEIYNAGDVEVYLVNCWVRIYNNGSFSPVNTVHLKAVTLLPGEVFVLGHPGISVPKLCDQLNAGLAFNGNDAIELVYQRAPHDVIGQIGRDPGPLGWGSRDTTTTDHTLRRKCSVSTGDSFGYDSFHPAVEWVAFPVNTFDGLGSHCQ